MHNWLRELHDQTVSSEHLDFFLFSVFFITICFHFGHVLQIKLVTRQPLGARKHSLSRVIVSYPKPGTDTRYSVLWPNAKRPELLTCWPSDSWTGDLWPGGDPEPTLPVPCRCTSKTCWSLVQYVNYERLHCSTVESNHFCDEIEPDRLADVIVCRRDRIGIVNAMFSPS